MSELSRAEVDIDNSMTATCACGEKFWLHYNGGELDRHECACGLFHQLEAPVVEYVVYDSIPGGRPE